MLLACTTSLASAQVRSLTLGIDVNSPYGLGEAWFDIREGLLREKAVASAAESPESAAGTAEVVPHDGRLMDPAKLAETLKSFGFGASLRGVEVRVAGEVEQTANGLRLKIPNEKQSISLVGLRELIELTPGTKERRKAAPAEKEALEKLRKAVESGTRHVEIRGPLRSEQGAYFIDVRQFSIAEPVSK